MDIAESLPMRFGCSLLGMEMAAMQRADGRIAVLAGGISDEREISLASGSNVMEALRAAGYGTVDLVDPGEEGFLTRLSDGGYDAAFVALHGRGGEDGMVQDILEFLQIPYTGSNPVSCAVAMDKDLSKLLYDRAGLPIAPSVAFTREDMPEIDDILAAVGPQSFVKPVSNGSSYGISLVKEPDELAGAIERAFGYGDKIMVEKRVVGVEVTCGVLGDGDTLRALPVVEICMPQQCEFYDLDVKYVDPTDIHRIPARLPADVYKRVQELSCAAHRALGCFGFSRTDMIVDASGPVILETNSIPGMTPASLFPDEVAHADMTFADACAELIDLALERAGR